MNSLVISNIALWLVVVVQSIGLLAVIRQLGILHDRIAPVGALMLRGGPIVGERAPEVQVLDLDGRSHAVGAPHPDGRSTLVVFVSPTCPVCKELLPVIKTYRAVEAAWLDVLLASDGDASVHRKFIDEQGLGAFRYILSTELGTSYHVNRLPFAALIDEKGVLRGRGIINSREHLESLFEAKRLQVASIQQYLQSSPSLRSPAKSSG